MCDIVQPLSPIIWELGLILTMAVYNNRNYLQLEVYSVNISNKN